MQQPRYLSPGSISPVAGMFSLFSSIRPDFLDMVFLDGDHRYESVMDDIKVQCRSVKGKQIKDQPKNPETVWRWVKFPEGMVAQASQRWRLGRTWLCSELSRCGAGANVPNGKQLRIQNKTSVHSGRPPWTLHCLRIWGFSWHQRPEKSYFWSQRYLNSTAMKCPPWKMTSWQLAKLLIMTFLTASNVAALSPVIPQHCTNARIAWYSLDHHFNLPPSHHSTFPILPPLWEQSLWMKTYLQALNWWGMTVWVRYETFLWTELLNQLLLTDLVDLQRPWLTQP